MMSVLLLIAVRVLAHARIRAKMGGAELDVDLDGDQ